MIQKFTKWLHSEHCVLYDAAEDTRLLSQHQNHCCIVLNIHIVLHLVWYLLHSTKGLLKISCGRKVTGRSGHGVHVTRVRDTIGQFLSSHHHQHPQSLLVVKVGAKWGDKTSAAVISLHLHHRLLQKIETGLLIYLLNMSVHSWNMWGRFLSRQELDKRTPWTRKYRVIDRRQSS